METLFEVVTGIERLGNQEALQWSNAFRSSTWSYRNLYVRIAAFARTLDERRIVKGDRIMIWSENRPEWVAAFWGAVVRGAEVVPIDYRFSPALARRIQEEAKPRLLVYGEAVDPGALSIDRIGINEISSLPDTLSLSSISLSRDDVVEIVYTSGTTGDPKGIVHRHRNICSNLEPFRVEIDKYKKWARPFQPIRILNLLPLSHMFGQSMGLFIPVLLGGSVVFTEEIRPSATIALIRKRRVSVAVSVPRILETLQHEVERRFQIPPAPSAKGIWGIAIRWWRSRRIRSAFAWKFWAFVVGGARVDPQLEEFWANLGYVVIQGYGLTEASPVVAVNHPFDTQRGSLGKVVPGQEVKIAADGEILVRGESVTGERGAWLATGDLGEIDKEGRLYYRGRKTDLVVTAEGLNIHPDDVERVLNSIPGIQESVVVPATTDGSDEVHAAVILSNTSADPAALIGKANEKLEVHQRIRSWTVWPDRDFPRTESTMKIRRHEVARRLFAGPTQAPYRTAKKSALDRVLERTAPTRLSEDLGLSSLDRVELLSEMEARYGSDVDEERFSQIRTVAELQKLATADRSESSLDRKQAVGRWPQSLPIRAIRFLVQRGLVFPLFNHYIPLMTDGLENLRTISAPVMFAANHTSHLDTIAILAALPPRWRRLVAPAMSKDFFRAWFEKASWKAGTQYALARSIFNTYPLAQRMAGVKASLEFTADLVQRGLCPLVFPEGERTPDGLIHPFRPGIGLMATRLQVPVIPIALIGLYKIFSVHDSWPKRGRGRVIFGKPLRFAHQTPIREATAAIEAEVRNLLKNAM